MSSRKKIVGSTTYPEKRRDKRKLNPTLVLSIDGESYPTADWSLGGALLSDYYGRREFEEEIEGKIRLATEPDSYPFTCKIVRHDLRNGQMALRFTELSEDAFTLLQESFIRQHH